MPPVPLFTRAELEEAFALILPPDVARSTAKQWWNDLADEVDDQGRFLYEDPSGDGAEPHRSGQVLAEPGSRHDGSRAAGL